MSSFDSDCNKDELLLCSVLVALYYASYPSDSVGKTVLSALGSLLAIVLFDASSDVVLDRLNTYFDCEEFASSRGFHGCCGFLNHRAQDKHEGIMEDGLRLLFGQ